MNTRALRRVAFALVGAACLVAIALPALAQSPGIPSAVAPGAEPELVQEGFVFTEGPLGLTDGASISPTYA